MTNKTCEQLKALFKKTADPIPSQNYTAINKEQRIGFGDKRDKSEEETKSYKNKYYSCDYIILSCVIC